MSAPVEIRTLRSLDAFEGLGENWDAMVVAMPRPSPYLLRSWLGPWWREHPEARPEVRVALRDGSPVAVLPLTVVRRAGIRVLRFPGGAEAALGDLLRSPDAPDGTAQALFDDLLTHPAHDVADLHGLPGDSVLGTLGSDLGALRVRQRLEAPVLNVTGSWEAVYGERFSKNRRAKHRRRRRRLAEQGDVRVRVVRDPDEIGPAMDEALRLHRLRWAGRSDGSEFGTARGARVNQQAFRALAADGVARVMLLECGGRVIAFRAFFVLAGRMYMHRSAFDPAFAEHMPGILTALEALQAGIDEGVTRVEFLGGADEYKAQFADDTDPLYVARGLAPTARGRAVVRGLEAATEARLRAKASPGVRRFYRDTLAPARRAFARVRSA